MTISIPDFPLPFEIPHMVHPFFVHFAIALPVVLLILELFNLAAKRKLITGINFFFMLLIVIVFGTAYLTGITDAKDIKLEALNAHKQLGVYLVYGSLVVLFFKLISMLINKIQIKIFFYLALIAFIATTFIEGKRGGELVYKYGVNVKAGNAQNTEHKANEPKAEQASNNTEANTSNEDTNNESNKIEAEPKKAVNKEETKEINATNEVKKEETKEPAENKHKSINTEANSTQENKTKENTHTEAVDETNKTLQTSESMHESNKTVEHNATTSKANATQETQH